MILLCTLILQHRGSEFCFIFWSGKLEFWSLQLKYFFNNVCTKFSSSKKCHERVPNSLRGVTMAVFCKRRLIGINKLVYFVVAYRETLFFRERAKIGLLPDKCVLELIPTSFSPQTTQSTWRGCDTQGNELRLYQVKF